MKMIRAKATIKCAVCGSEIVIPQYKIGREAADFWKGWMQENGQMLCTNCRRERHASDEDEIMPKLMGSPKQIEWAMTIRREKLAEIDKWIESDHIKARKAVGDIKADRRRMGYERCREIMTGRVDASWWIDRRNKDGIMILMDVYQANSKEIDAIQ